MRTTTLDLLDLYFKSERATYNALPQNVKFSYSEEKIVIDPANWDKFYPHLSSIPFNWNEIKYDQKIDITSVITSNDPGVYIFYIRPDNCIIHLPRFVLYVGIAGATAKLNPLKNRLSNYFRENEIKKRKPLHRLLGKYYNHAYVAYSLLPNLKSKDILKIEKHLLGFLYPIANIEDFPAEIQEPRKSFNIAT